MKATIVILSDPKNGSEEALGRVFNGLAAAYDFKQAGEDVSVVFQGTGTRWIAELNQKQHPAHDLFEAVKDQVAGVSCGCADVFGASEDASKPRAPTDIQNHSLYTNKSITNGRESNIYIERERKNIDSLLRNQITLQQS